MRLNYTATAITAHTAITAESLYCTQGNILKQRPGVSLPRDFHVQSVLYVMVWGVRQRWTTGRGCGCGQSHLNRSLSLTMQLYQVCHSTQIITGREHRAVSKYFLWSCLPYQWVQIQRLYSVSRNLHKKTWQLSVTAPLVMFTSRLHECSFLSCHGGKPEAVGQPRRICPNQGERAHFLKWWTQNHTGSCQSGTVVWDLERWLGG